MSVYEKTLALRAENKEICPYLRNPQFEPIRGSCGLTQKVCDGVPIREIDPTNYIPNYCEHMRRFNENPKTRETTNSI